VQKVLNVSNRGSHTEREGLWHFAERLLIFISIFIEKEGFFDVLSNYKEGIYSKKFRA